MMQTCRCLFLSLIATASVPAATIIVNPNPTVSTSAIIDGITGADMTGLFMTATYNTPGHPTTVSATWAATGPTSGKADAGGAVAVVSLTGDTGANLAWHYSGTFLSPLLQITLDGTAAGIYFDRTSTAPTSARAHLEPGLAQTSCSGHFSSATTLRSKLRTRVQWRSMEMRRSGIFTQR